MTLRLADVSRIRRYGAAELTLAFAGRPPDQAIRRRWRDRTASACDRSGGSGDDGEEPPCGGDALQLLFATIVEVDGRACDEIDHGP
jgi:hypothetical protein